MTERSEHISSSLRRTSDLIPAAALIVLTLAVYWPVFRFEFLNWDDTANVVDNPLLKQLSLENILHFWQHPYYGLYIPVTYMTWSWLATVTMKPWLFHAANLLLHVTCGVLVYAILRRLLDHPRAAFLGAAIFCVHPVQVETVAWVSAFRDLLCATFMFIAIWTYLRREIAITLIAFVLAILSKPTAIVLPLMLLVLRRIPPSSGTSGDGRGGGSFADQTFASHQQNPRPAHLRSTGAGEWDKWGAVAAMFAIAIACIIWTRAAQPSTQLRSSPLWSRPLVALDALAFYLYKLVWPAKLGFDYGRTPQEILLNRQAFFTWLVPAGVAVIIIALPRRYRRVILGSALIFVIGVLPVLGLVPFDFQDKSTVADHYLYVSMLGVALFAGAIVAWRDVAMTRTIVALVVVAFALSSWLQTWTWQNTTSLAENGLRVNPRSWVSLNLLAFASNRPQLVERLSREALDIRPDQIDAMINLGVALTDQDRLHDAVTVFERAVRTHPDIADAHADLGGAYAKLGRFIDAQRECERAIQIEPNHRQARLTLDRLRQMKLKPSTRPAATMTATATTAATTRSPS